MPTRYVAVKEEASYAPTPAVTPNQFFDANRAEANLEENHTFPTSMRGRSIFEVRENYYQDKVTWQTDVKPNNQIGWFLKWALGSVTSSQQGATTAYLHTFKAADTLRSFAWAYNFDSLIEKRVPGCILQNIKFSVARGANPLQADFTAIGQGESLVAVQSPSGWSTLAPFKPFHSKVHIAGSELVNLAEGMTINIANKVYDIGDIGVLGNRKLTRIEVGERTISGTLDIPVTSGTLDLYKRYLKDTGATEPGEPVVPFSIKLATDTGVVIAGAYNYKIDFTMPKCVLTSAPPPMEKQERKRISLGWKAIYDSGEASEIKVELQNTETEYPDAT